MKNIIVIPSRLSAVRLPNKPLAEISGVPMIVRVWQQAVAANAGPVLVAAGDAEIVDVIQSAGGDAVLTDAALPSGSDRIMAALQQVDAARNYDTVLNLQGDMPFVAPETIQACLAVLQHTPADIATVVAPPASEEDRTNPNVVKAILANSSEEFCRALYFTRSTPYGSAPVFRHIGIYGYRRSALEQFNAAPPSILEQREKLEQLRALELGLTVWTAKVDDAPISVDSAEDLERARAFAQGAGR